MVIDLPSGQWIQGALSVKLSLVFSYLNKLLSQELSVVFILFRKGSETRNAEI